MPSSIVNLIAGVAALVAGGIILAPGLVKLMAPGFQGKTLTRAIVSTRILFAGRALFGGAVLNSFKDFTVPALGPVVQNLMLVAGLIALLPLGRSCTTPLGCCPWRPSP